MDPIVILAATVVPVGPGQEQRVAVRVSNRSRRVEAYHIDVLGVPGTFAEVSDAAGDPVSGVVSVLPGQDAELAVVFRPPAGATAPTGSLPFAVRATSEVDRSASAVAEGCVEIAGVAGLQAWAHPTTRAGRWSATFQLEFKNPGNAALRLAVDGDEPKAMTTVTVEPDTIDLAPGATRVAALKVRARRPFLRGSTVNRAISATSLTYPFGAERPRADAIAPGSDPNLRTFALVYEQRPILPKFLLPLVALVVVALVALAAVVMRANNDVVQLGITNPEPPQGLRVTAAGATTVRASWDEVPNAVAYEVRLVSVAGVPSDEEPQVFERDQFVRTDEGLLPATEYCYDVQAIGIDEKPSDRSGTQCATTGAEAEILAPENVSAVHEGGDGYRVTWSYDPGVTAEFQVFVDDQPEGQPVPGPDTRIEIESDVEERTAVIEVQAIVDDQHSDLSAPFDLQVVAAPVPTEPTAVATTIESSVAPTTPATSEPPVATTTTSTTVAAQAVVPIGDLPEQWVAMLGALPDGSGLTREQRTAQFATEYGNTIDSSAIRWFSNRDTVADDIVVGAPSVPPGSEFGYVQVADQIAAQTICFGHVDCRAMLIRGATVNFASQPVVVVGVLAIDVPEGTLDERIVTLRASSPSNMVYVLQGPAHPELGSAGMVLYATGFADEAAAAAYCTPPSPPPPAPTVPPRAAPCLPGALAAAG